MNRKEEDKGNVIPPITVLFIGAACMHVSSMVAMIVARLVSLVCVKNQGGSWHTAWDVNAVVLHI